LEKSLPLEDALPRGLDLMDKVREESGKKTLDEILREGEAEKRAETRKNESRRDLLEHMTEAAKAQLDLDTKATVVRRAK
jgi:hypothetical protein